MASSSNTSTKKNAGDIIRAARAEAQRTGGDANAIAGQMARAAVGEKPSSSGGGGGGGSSSNVSFSGTSSLQGQAAKESEAAAAQLYNRIKPSQRSRIVSDVTQPTTTAAKKDFVSMAEKPYSEEQGRVISKFEEKAQFPYGREAQKVAVTRIQEQQAAIPTKIERGGATFLEVVGIERPETYPFRVTEKAGKKKLEYIWGRKEEIGLAKTTGYGLLTASSFGLFPAVAGGGVISRFGVGSVNFAKNLGLGYAISRGAVEGSKILYQKAAPPEEKKYIEDIGTFKKAMQSGFKAEEQAIGQKPFFKRTAMALPGMPLIYGEGAAFEKGVIGFYEERGLKGDELFNAVRASLRMRKGGEYGELFGVVGANVFSEAYGEKLVGNIFKGGKSVIKGKYFSSGVFKKVFPQIFKAGVVEGVSVEAARQSQQYEKQSVSKLGISGALGGVSAGLIGGAIAGFAAPRPKVSKTLLVGAYFTDPYEYPGDVLAGAAIKRFKLPVLTPVLIDTTTKRKAPTMIQLGVTQQTITPAQTPTKTTIPTKTPVTSSAFINSIIPTTLPSSTSIITTTPTPTPIDTTTTTPTNTITTITTQTTVTTPTTVPVGIPVNVVVPRYQIPPILPLLPGANLGYSGGSGAKGGRKLYINELAYAFGLVGIKPTKEIKREMKVKETKKSKKEKKVKTPRFSNLLGFNKMAFGR